MFSTTKCNHIVAISILLISSILMISGACSAERTEQGAFVSQGAACSYNPLGLQLDSKVLYRIPLIRKDGVLWESTRFEAGLANEWTPADDYAAAFMTIEPIALFDLTLRAGWYGVYNALGFGLYRFDYKPISYSPATLADHARENARGWWFSAIPRLKAKFGPVIILNSLAVNMLSLDTEGWYADVRTWALQKSRDVTYVNEACALYEMNPWLMAGGQYRYLHVYGTGYDSHRLCAVAIATPAKGLGGKPYIAALAGAYLDDPCFGQTAYIAIAAGVEWKIR